jgi:hypothetical protein
MSHPKHNIFLNIAKQSNSKNIGAYLPALSGGSTHKTVKKIRIKM